MFESILWILFCVLIGVPLLIAVLGGLLANWECIEDWKWNNYSQERDN